jgi:peptidyl-prolyl cis-trans isomerase A (cyclophilin A)
MWLLLVALLMAQTISLPRLVIETDAGEIEVEIDSARAPTTAANFLKYVELGLYDDGRFHRAVRKDPDNQPQNEVKIEVIQGAANSARRNEFPPAIPLERTSITKLSHKDGTLSMARSGPDTGRSEFFICIGDQPELDFGGKRNADGQGFAAFGRVIRGMDIVRKIQGLPADGQTLQPTVRIVRIRPAR